MKKLVALFLALSLMLVSFSVVAEEDKPKSMTIWVQTVLYDEAVEYMVNTFEAFGEENGIEINVETCAYSALSEKWASAIESGNLPDVSIAAYGDVANFVGQDLLYDLTDCVARIQENNTPYSESALKAVTHDGKVYCAPYQISGQAFVYRTDLLEATGKEVPATWEEFREVVKAMTDVDAGIYGAGLGYGLNNTDSEQFIRSVIFSYGGSIFNEDNTAIVLNSPETIEAVKLLVGIYEDGSMPVSATNWDDSGNNTGYLTGQVATAFNAPTLIVNMDDEMRAVSTVGAIPSGPAGVVNLGTVNGFMVFKNSPAPEWSEKAIEYVMQSDRYAGWIDRIAPVYVPTFEVMRDADIWKDGVNKDIISCFSNVAYLGYPGPTTTTAGALYSGRYMNKMILDVIVNGMTVEDAVARTAEMLQAEYFGE